MTRFRTPLLGLCAGSLLLALSTAGRGQPPSPPPSGNPLEGTPLAMEPLPLPEGAPEELAALVRELADEGVQVDFQRKRVIVRGAILLDRMNAGYPIEFLLVNEHGSVHESLGIVRCTPSKLNAAFLALGLEPGRTVQFVRRDPPPPLEKLETGEEREFDLVPPKGAVVDLAVEWEEDGERRFHPIEDLIAYLTNGKPLPRRGFVFVGSRFQRVLVGTERKERFLADVEGNIASLWMSGLGNCLFDPNGVEGVEGSLYDVNPASCPKRGTRVDFVFQVRA